MVEGEGLKLTGVGCPEAGMRHRVGTQPLCVRAPGCGHGSAFSGWAVHAPARGYKKVEFSWASVQLCPGYDPGNSTKTHGVEQSAPRASGSLLRNDEAEARSIRLTPCL